jgi:pyruvate dehydrogenase (quinone)
MPIALVGDGAMQMLGINGMITIASQWKRWKDPRFMILVLNNQDLNMVSWEQRIMEGDAKFEASQDVHKFNYAAYAEILGFEGIRIEKEEDIIPAIERAMQAQRPVVVDVLSDPSVPPLPPHISFKQAREFTSAVFKGDVDAWDMIKQTYKDVVENYLPHK